MARAHTRGTIFHRYIFRTNICLLYSFYIYFTEEPGTQKTDSRLFVASAKKALDLFTRQWLLAG